MTTFIKQFWDDGILHNISVREQPSRKMNELTLAKLARHTRYEIFLKISRFDEH